jgi:hypothetical protein
MKEIVELKCKNKTRIKCKIKFVSTHKKVWSLKMMGIRAIKWDNENKIKCIKFIQKT